MRIASRHDLFVQVLRYHDRACTCGGQTRRERLVPVDDATRADADWSAAAFEQLYWDTSKR